MLYTAQPLLPLLDLMAPRPAPPRTTRSRSKARAREPTPLPPMAVAEPDAFHAAQLRALRQAFVGLVERWNLSGLEALTLLGEPRAGDEERHERLRLLVGVHRLLLLAWPEAGRCQDVLRQACPALGGTAPLSLMLAGGRPAMEQVRDYLVGRAK